jgi:hypothetical protein
VRYAGLDGTSISHDHLRTLTYTRVRTDTNDSPDDQQLVARNMYKIGINKYKAKTVSQVGYLQRL